MVAVGGMMGFYPAEEALKAVDLNTIGLLLGMMIMVNVLEETGFLEYAAITMAKKTAGDPWLLTVTLGTFTTFLSFILDNVTTVVLVVPITLVIARTCRISPVPMLLAEAILSDTGGVATLVGDPPNIIIGSAAGFSFNQFLAHLGPPVLVAWVAVLLVLRLVFRRQLRRRPVNVDEILSWDASKALKDGRTCGKVLFCLGLTTLLFLFHHRMGLLPSSVTLVGAALTLLLVSPRKDPQYIFGRVSWSVLLFFVGLFILVGGVEHAGVVKRVAEGMLSFSKSNLLMAALAVLWGGAVLSAVIDNVPFTMAMVPLISRLDLPGGGVDVLWWALALGVGFGGNGTPIGSTANVVVVSHSEQTDEPITFGVWLKGGTLSMLVSCLVATAAVALMVYSRGRLTG